LSTIFSLTIIRLWLPRSLLRSPSYITISLHVPMDPSVSPKPERTLKEALEEP
jgi:hypothetical protein